MTDAQSDFSPNLQLPFLLPAQAQKHVTVNESLAAIDTLVMAAVISADLSAPPDDLSNGDAYILPSPASGVWQGHANALAVWSDGAWTFHSPREGWRVWDKNTSGLLVFDGNTWDSFAASDADFQNLSLLGVAATADTDNPLSVRGAGALFTALETEDGGSGDIRLSINSEAGAHSGSVVFQSGWRGRAEIGLTSASNFAIRTSADGASWLDALAIDPDTNSIGVGLEPNSADAFAVDGQVTFFNDGGYFSFRESNRLLISNDDGGPIYVHARSPGSNLHFGATEADGTWQSNIIVLKPGAEEVQFGYPLRPQSADTIDIGGPFRPFRNLYLQNAPVVSSDKRGKQDIETFDAGLDLVNALRPVTYRRACEPDLRHLGLVAQEVLTALEDNDADDFALWQCADPDDPNSQQAVVYAELIPALIDAVQELSERVEILEGLTRDL